MKTVIPTIEDINYLTGLIVCLRKQVDNLTTVVNNNTNIDKPPITIPWSAITGNKYLNQDLFNTTYVVYLNGVDFLTEGMDYDDLSDSDSPQGGFEIINPDLQDVPNVYIIIR